jgi:hypothetical protein
MTERELAMAKRCQLVTGSFEGNEHSCPCKCQGDCKFTREEIEAFWKLDVIKKITKERREACLKLTEGRKHES